MLALCASARRAAAEYFSFERAEGAPVGGGRRCQGRAGVAATVEKVGGWWEFVDEGGEQQGPREEVVGVVVEEVRYRSDGRLAGSFHLSFELAGRSVGASCLDLAEDGGKSAWGARGPKEGSCGRGPVERHRQGVGG